MNSSLCQVQEKLATAEIAMTAEKEKLSLCGLGVLGGSN